MTAEEWYSDFTKRFAKYPSFKRIKPFRKKKGKESLTPWTRAMTELIHSMGEQNGYYCYCRKGGKTKGEQLTMDFMWFDKTEYRRLEKRHKEISEYYPPTVAIEHETHASKYANLRNVLGSFWKVMCIRADINIFIGYFLEDLEKDQIINYIEELIKYTSLLKGMVEVLVLLGDGNNISNTRTFIAWELGKNQKLRKIKN